MTLAYDQPTTWHRPIAVPKSGWLPSALLLTIVFVSFQPFATGTAPEPGTAPSGGNIINQLGFSLVGLISFLLIVKKVGANALSAFITPTWFLISLILMMSVLNADNPAGAMRAMIFTLSVMLAGAAALLLLRNLSDLVSALAFSTTLTMVFCYFAVFFVPEIGVHESSGFEAQHAGLWRGVYPHKNLTSYIMGAFSIIGIFLMRNGKPWLGAVLTLSAVLFTVNAGSKTVLVVFPATLGIMMFANWVTWRPLKALIITLPVIALIMATLGAVIYEPILEELRRHIPGLSYTGRTDLWMFGLDHLSRQPWLGYGFESFWATPRVTGMDQPIELSWDVRGIVNGHNSWMDAMVVFGIPAGLFICFALFVIPVRDFIRVPATGNAGKIASLFISIWILLALGASLESFFFNRSNQMWFLLLLAVFGLRLTAHLSREQFAPLRTR